MMVATSSRPGRGIPPLFRGGDSKFGLEEKGLRGASASRWHRSPASLVIIPGSPTPTLRCSRSSCEAPPEWDVLWRNPKIHGPERQKIWLACTEHREYFESYLSQKGFPVSTIRRGDGGH